MKFCPCNLIPAQRYVKEQIPVVTKKEAERNANRKALLGAAIGAAAGVLIGLEIASLTLPNNGEENRKAIKNAIDENIEAVKQTASDAIATVTDYIEGLKANGDDEVTVEYTIHYDDEVPEGSDEATTEDEAAEEEDKEEAAE